MNIKIVEHNGETWASLSDIMREAGNLDLSTLKDKLAIEPIITSIKIPGQDGRTNWIKAEDCPILFTRYSKQKEVFAHIVAHVSSEKDGVNNMGNNTPTPPLPHDSPEQDGVKNPGLPKPTPPLPAPTPDSLPQNTRGKKHGVKPENPMFFWDTWGILLGRFLSSSLVAYLALLCLIITLSILHSVGAARLITNIAWIELWALCLLIQSIILIGTVNSNHFGNEAGYRLFLAGFGIYDSCMTAVNFFYGWDPSPLWSPVPAELIAAIIGLVVRIAFTISFTIGTIFFATLVRKMRAV